MNQNKKVLQFTLLATSLLLALSLFMHFNKTNLPMLQNISIVTDVLKQKDSTKNIIEKPHIAENLQKDTAVPLPNMNVDASRILVHFNTPNRITNFYKDTNQIVIDSFIKKLVALKKSKKGKIRIAYLGDSMIEGDLVSQTLRRLLQSYFGGSG
ncbi:MAG: hypothetical protein ACOVO1_03450, partial [Chitinophagaceae bacterium]